MSMTEINHSWYTAWTTTSWDGKENMNPFEICPAYDHRWALSPIFVISDIELSLISEPLISDWESEVRHYVGYRSKVLSDIRYPTSFSESRSFLAEWHSVRLKVEGTCVQILLGEIIFLMLDIGIDVDIDIGTLLTLKWLFSVRHICLRYQNNRCQCRISPTLRLSMPTYANDPS